MNWKHLGRVTIIFIAGAGVGSTYIALVLCWSRFISGMFGHSHQGLALFLSPWVIGAIAFLYFIMPSRGGKP